MFVDTARSRALLGHLLAQLSAPSESTPLYVLAARQSALQAAVDVTDLGMKACGGAAFSKHLGIERHMRDAKVCQIGEGTNEIQRLVIARQLFDDARGR